MADKKRDILEFFEQMIPTLFATSPNIYQANEEKPILEKSVSTLARIRRSLCKKIETN
jgi:hypothetical protein